jgi:hypothetical protein
MKQLLERMLGLDSLHFGQEGVEFGFAHPLPGWGWFLVGVGALLIALYSYRRLEGTRWIRTTLGLVRAAILVLLVLLITGPRLLKPNETEEKDWVIVVADRSASMTVRDAPSNGAESRSTRESQLRDALQESARAWAELSKDRVVSWIGFDAQARELKPSGDPAIGGGVPVDLGDPSGRRTAIGAAMEQALRRAAARPVSGIVLLTDGRSIDEPSKAVSRRLEAERIPVFVVPLGSPEPVADISVRRADGPRNAFLNDFVPVEVEVERLGSGGGTAASGAKPKVQLVDADTGAVLDERELDFPAPVTPSTPSNPGDPPGQSDPAQTAQVTLTTQATTQGSQRWKVRVVPGGPDLVTENNEADVGIEMLGRPLRVAYFDGYPRWEYRYLKNLLVREESFKASSMLLSSGRRFVLEGEANAMMSIPRSPEEWREYDVVVIGDVRPEMFTSEQLEQVKDHVAVRGAGLVWIGGEGATPGAWRGTPLEDLLPFALPELVDRSGDGGPPPWDDAVTVVPTLLAQRLGVLRLAPTPVNGSWWPAELADPRVGWSALRWAQHIDPATLKPTAEVLAIARSTRASSALADAAAQTGPDVSPLVISMRFGAGRTLFVGTDEIWRWRYGRGEFYPERFWLQMLRMLGRESLSRAGKAATVEVLPRRAEVDQPMRVAVTLLDQSLVDAAPASLRVRLIREGDVGPGAKKGEPGPPIELILLPEGTGAASRSGRAASRKFAATWVATESGKYRLEVHDPLIAGFVGPDALTAEAEVWLPEDELRHPETNHPLLQRLSQASGGKVLTAAELNDLPKLLPNRRLRLAGEPDVETLWDTPLALFLMMLLLTVEWVVRRLIKLA